MSRRIMVNNIVCFEPEKKKISGKNGTYSLSASAALCFELLLNNAGNLVSHQEFYEYAWRRFGMEPTSTSLYQNISTLRSALKKSGLTTDIIRTMPRRGFLLSPLTEIVREQPKSNENTGKETQEIAVMKNNDVAITPESSVNEIITEKMSPPVKPSSDRAKKNGITMLITAFAGVMVGGSFFFIKNEPQEKNLFTSEAISFSGCKIFTNRDSVINKEKVVSIASAQELQCNKTPYIYMTSYKYSDRLSLILCQQPLNGEHNANCHSLYYIKSFRK